MYRESADSPLLAFLPQAQLDTIAARGGQADRPVARAAAGALLFADLTGFTALTSALAVHGVRGAEEVSSVINASFKPLTECIREHGGDVLAYAGDAVLALWPAGDDAALADAVHAAAETALALASAPLATRGEHALELRISIGAGALTLSEVGGANGEWMFLASGDPILQAATADKLSRAGAPVLSPEASALVATRCRLAPLGNGHAQLLAITTPSHYARAADASQVNPDELRSRLLPAVTERLRAGQADWITEFRNVSVAFIGLPALDAAQGDELARLHEAARAVQESVLAHGGGVYQFLMDDKGITLVAAFGLPGQTHSDDASRSVRAVLAAEKRLRALGHDGCAGIATGMVYCGIYGTDERRQYVIVGPTINLAARLLQAARTRGGALCDSATRDASARDESPGLAYAAVEGIRAKGIGESVPAFAPTIADAVAQPRSAPAVLVGRRAERVVAQKAIEGLAAERTSSVIVIEGEPGVGKTALLEWMLADAKRAGALCLTGMGDEIETRTPYFAVRSIVAGAFGIDLASSRDAMQAAVAARLASDAELARGAPLLNAILPLALEDTEWTRFMPADARAENLRTLVLRVLQARAAVQPLVVAVDDAQWMDAASWSLVQLVGQHVQPALLLLTTRPTETRGEAFSALASSAGCNEIHLGPLEPDDADALVAHALGAKTLAPDVAAFIREHAGGHPFFSLEVARGLRDAGAIQLRGDTAVAGALESWPVAGNVRGAVNMRIERLGPDAQLALRVASVFGRTFSSQALDEVYPRGSLSHALDELQRRDFVSADANRSGAFRFSQAITRDVAYDALVFSQRRELHGAVARWYEGAHAHELPMVYERLGYHWRHAERPRRAAAFLGGAGEQALAGYNNEAAVRFLDEALALAAEAPLADAETGAPPVEPRRWHLLAGRAAANWTHYADARAHLETGLALSGERVPTGQAGAVAQILGQVGRQVAHRRAPARFVGRQAKQQEALADVLAALVSMVETYYVEGAMLPCVNASLRSLNLAELVDDKPNMARGYSSVGAMLSYMPMPSAAERYFARAVDMAERGGDPSAVSWVLLSVALYHAGRGDWDVAENTLVRAAAVAAELGDRRRWEDCTHHVATVNLLRGRLDDALAGTRALEASAKGADSSGSAPRGYELHAVRLAAALRIRTHVLIALHRTDEAAATVAELDALVQGDIGIAPRERNLMMGAANGLVLLERGDVAGAFAAAGPALEVLAKASTRSYDFFMEYAALAKVCHAACDARLPGAVAAARSIARVLKMHARVFPIARQASIEAAACARAAKP